MNPALCKNFEKCPIYNGLLKGQDGTSAIYIHHYCEAGEKGWSNCKRYLVKERTGRCPADLLPNAKKSVDEIVAGMH